MRLIAILALTLITFVTSAQKSPAPQVFPASGGTYTIRYYKSNIIRLTYTPKGYLHNEQLSDAVILPPAAATASAVKVKVNGDVVSFNGKALMVNADTSAGMYAFNFALETNEKIYGGGERALPLNRRGYRFNLYNNPWYGYGMGADNLNYSVPFFTSSKGYGLFFDNPSKGFADIGKAEENIFRVGFCSGELSVYVILGDSPADILQSYHQLTGTQPLPPRWAMGNLMSRFGYTSETQTRSILQQMNTAGIPVEAIIFDLFWFGDSIKGTLGNLSWKNTKKWPAPAKMISDFRKEGIQTILVTEPFFVETSSNYQASRNYLAVDSLGRPYYLTDFYFGKGGLIDIFRKDSKDWFWQFYKKQMDLGVEAWWGDLGEPEKHPADLYHNLRDKGYKRLFSANEVHNIYGHNWTKMLFEKYASTYPNKRLFSLNRSGFAGSQRYSIFPWTGDVSRSWNGFRAQLPVLLGMAMSGVPYVHSDAGGFAGGEGDNELYVRWLQFAAFTPIFRPHGTALYEAEPAAFSFPSEVALIDTPWRSYAKEAIEARYALLPYNYTLAYQQARYGKPLMAPLYYYFSSDTVAVNVQDEYMWGENVLVAPVLEKGASTRKIYLPRGTWYNDQQKFEGGIWIEQPVAMKDIPLFYKAGAFIPCKFNLFTARNTANTDWNEFMIAYGYSATPSKGLLYLDDGSSKNAISTSNYKLLSFSSKKIAAKQLEITVTTTGKYKATTAVKLGWALVGCGEVKSIKVNGRTLSFDSEKDTKMFSFPHLRSSRIVVELK